MKKSAFVAVGPPGAADTIGRHSVRWSEPAPITVSACELAEVLGGGGKRERPRSYKRARVRRLLDEPSCRYAKRLCQFFHDGHRWITRAALDVADIGAVNAGLMGKGLLTPALLLAEDADVLTQACAYIHAELKTRASTINLQTISDNLVDCRPLPSIDHVTHRRRRSSFVAREETGATT